MQDTTSGPMILGAADAATLGAAVREVARTRFAPISDVFGERSEVCPDLVAAMAGAGFFEVLLQPPTSWVGAHRWTAHSVIREALALEDNQAEEIYTIQNLGLYPLVSMGTPAQRKAYLEDLRRGRKLAAFALTEPDAGSDLGRMTTSVREAPAGWILEGEKTFISHAPDADLYVVFARDGDGTSGFLVEKGTPGFELDPSMELMAPHAIGTLRFRNCEIGRDALLGERHQGLRTALRSLEFFRPSVGARAVGMSRRAVELALAWAGERVVFGRELIRHQTVAFKLADLVLDISAARATVYEAARRADAGHSVAFEGSVAKAFATEVAQRVVWQAQQLIGGRGVVAGHPIERLYRQVRAMTIYEGTSEVQRMIIGRHLTQTEGQLWEF